MRKFFIALIAALCIISCGRKDDPLPKSTLDIPLPDKSLVIAEDGVYVTNNSDTFPIVLERAVSEVGDLNIPRYQVIAKIYPGETFVDDTIEYNVRYIYRFTSEHNRYAAVSESITQVVSYRGVVKIESAGWSFNREQVCLDVEASRSTLSVEVIINGQNKGVYSQSSPCYNLEPIPEILLVLVPYSDGGLPGAAFSETIKWDAEDLLLPPSNIKVIRRGDRVTLSWDASADVTAYRIYYLGGVQTTDATLITLTGASGCTQYKITSVSGGKESRAVAVESCP